MEPARVIATAHARRLRAWNIRTPWGRSIFWERGTKILLVLYRLFKGDQPRPRIFLVLMTSDVAAKSRHGRTSPERDSSAGRLFRVTSGLECRRARPIPAAFGAR